jgi:hypothetical protein
VFSRILREIFYAEPPATELGRIDENHRARVAA